MSSKDVIYSPGYNAGITRARQLLNVHDLIHLQIESERSLAKTIYYNTIVRSAIKHAGVVMTDSTASATAIALWLRSPKVDIVNVGCGRSKAFVAEGVSANFDHPTFLYVGNMNKPHKNFRILLEAIALRPQYKLLVVTGDFDLATSMVRGAGLDAQVEVRTAVPDDELARLYRGASGSLQPSLLEGFGLPPLEAMSCGTRVAYWSGCESVSEIVDGTGVAVSSATDASEWARAMEELETMSLTGPLSMPREWDERYSWDTVADKVNAVLSRACEQQ
ncbi:glycosyltransferase family 1 protein [Cryobacterium sp. Hh7]|uniref:glycosyltransferase family 4 protein n=1 Tax=Cryobacterium sp. Hh7 TaxID=1259159 RepID=UPI00141A944B|nr:glycosyltransferase family 1 protein [Cryobacterium sp. Hh7]